MKKLLLMAAAVAALAVTATPAAAQYPAGPVMPAGGCTHCDPGFGYGHGHGGYGFGGGHVSGLGGKLKGGMFGFGLFAGLFTNHGGGGSGGTPIQAVDPRSGNAGQLAFPQNPFIRSPRDYFMWDER